MIKKILLLFILSSAYAYANAQCPSFDYGCGCGVPHYVCAGGGSGGGGSSYVEPDYWGAVVRGRNTSHFFIRYNYKNKKEVTKIIYEDCEKVYGKGQCEGVSHFVNQCYAVAAGPRYFSGNFGNSLDQAQERALRSCQYASGEAKCNIVVANCSK